MRIKGAERETPTTPRRIISFLIFYLINPVFIVVPTNLDLSNKVFHDILCDSLQQFSKAKWPLFIGTILASGKSFLNDTAPGQMKEGSSLTQIASSFGWCSRRYCWNTGYASFHAVCPYVVRASPYPLPENQALGGQLFQSGQCRGSSDARAAGNHFRPSEFADLFFNIFLHNIIGGA